MFCHGKGLCKKLMEREWLTSLGINVGNLQEIGSRFPMVFSEALVWLVAQSRLTLYNLMDCSLPSSSVHGILQAKILEWVAIPFSGGSSQARDRTHVSCIVDSLPSKPPGKPKNTGVGSLSLLQWIFPTQELNWGLLHCRQILYQLSYQGSPRNDPQTGEKFYQRSSHTFAKVLGPTTDFPTWGSRKRTEHP